MIKSIGECFYQIQNGANIKQGEVDGGFPITRIETTANDKFNRDRMGYAGIADITQYESYVLEDGDLLMSHINSVQYLGRTVLYVKRPNETIIHGMNLLRLKANKDVIDPAYAKYYFNGHLFRSELGKITKKSVNQASFTVKDLKKIKIIIPPMLEQERIVFILDKIKIIIDNYQKQLEKYDALIKARFVEMFGNFERNSMGWEIQPFSYFASIDGNMTTDFDKYADYPHIGVGNIEKDTGNLIDYKTIREDNVISGKYLFTPEHIIYSKIRPNLNKVALPAFEGLCSADAYPILPKKENCNRIFLAIAMRSDYFLGYILQFSSRTNMPKVNRKEISSFKMPLPPLSLQNEFADFFKLIYKSKFVELKYYKNRVEKNK